MLTRFKDFLTAACLGPATISKYLAVVRNGLQRSDLLWEVRQAKSLSARYLATAAILKYAGFASETDPTMNVEEIRKQIKETISLCTENPKKREHREPVSQEIFEAIVSSIIADSTLDERKKAFLLLFLHSDLHIGKFMNMRYDDLQKLRKSKYHYMAKSPFSGFADTLLSVDNWTVLYTVIGAKNPSEGYRFVRSEIKKAVPEEIRNSVTPSSVTLFSKSRINRW